MLLLVALLAGCGSDSDEARGPALPNGETCPPGTELDVFEDQAQGIAFTRSTCIDNAGTRYGYGVESWEDGSLREVWCVSSSGEQILSLGYDFTRGTLSNGWCLGPEEPFRYEFQPQQGDVDFDRSPCHPCP